MRPVDDTIAMVWSDDVHVAEPVMSWVPPPESVSVAVNCDDSSP
jgi:hypothetical protein